MAEIGRNAPCPCGSGKKHKRCCWGTRPPPPPSALPAQEGMPLPSTFSPRVLAQVKRYVASVSENDCIDETYEALLPLLAPAGPLAGIRFETAQFVALVEQGIQRAEKRRRSWLGLLRRKREEDAPAWLEVLREVGPELCDDAWLSRAVEDLAAVAGRSSGALRPLSETATAALVWLLPASAGDQPAWRSYTAEAVFDAQLRELHEQSTALDDAVSAVLQSGGRDKLRDHAQLLEAAQELESKVSGSPMALARLQVRLEGQVDRAFEALDRGFRAPLLSGPELLLLQVGLAVAAQGWDDEAPPESDQGGRLDGLMEEAERLASAGLADRMAERCTAAHAGARGKDRARWTDLSAACRLEPARLALTFAMMRSPPIHPSAPGVQAAWSVRFDPDVADAVDELIDAVRQAGDALVADELERAREGLQLVRRLVLEGDRA